MSELLPLTELPVGQRLRLVRVDGGERLRRRLMALGISIGGHVELVQRRGGGVVLARDGNRVALGAGIAHRLYAEPLE
jgi:Fe2+ transport system protein FeoA